MEPESSQRVKFRTRLVHPSLFAIAVNERDYPSEALLPLRCSLYVSYPILEASASVSGVIKFWGPRENGDPLVRMGTPHKLCRATDRTSLHQKAGRAFYVGLARMLA